jgi:Zn-dependent peptidase ImmA (M78 family)
MGSERPQRETYDARQIHEEQSEGKLPRWTDIIKQFIKNNNMLAEREQLKGEHIFSLLHKSATVFYFPRTNVMNKGYYFNYRTLKGIQHLVYINTRRSKEKQAFSAAHEYGHTLDIITIINNYFTENNDRVPPELWERTISRFASELMMPEKEFRDYVGKMDKNFSSMVHPESTHYITHIMNEFFMPYRAVVYRLRELDLVKDNDAQRLYGANDREKANGYFYHIDDIEKESCQFARENSYVDLYQYAQKPNFDTAKREILGVGYNGLDDLLEELARVVGDEEGRQIKFARNFGRDFIDYITNDR